MWERIEAGLKHNFHEQPQVQAKLAGMCAQVMAGELAPSTAARQLLAIANGESANGLGDSL
jgi:LAO/AO transport system kinase